MIDDETVRLVSALAAIDQRGHAADRLAALCGAKALLILVEDRATGSLLPAPGFGRTLPGGATWRDFRSRARQDGLHRGELAYPDADTRAPALAFAESGVVVVFIDPDGDGCIEVLRPLMPLLAAMCRAEHDLISARGEQRAAQNHAREAEVLALAFDSARAETEATLTALEEQSRALEEARTRAEEATRAKDEFLAMLGHELRNPLSPILTALQLMRLKGQHSREQDVIERQVSNVIRLVDDLLDMSRITRGKVELHKERVEVGAVAARAIEMASPGLERTRHSLVVEIAPAGMPVDADPGRLAQVFANLLTNAAKYSRPETTILFAAERRGSMVRVSVVDQGVGIRPDMLERVFDAFEQARQSAARPEGGLGLGLAIVRNLVVLHGGRAWALSEGEGRGSEFVVELPVADAGALRPEPAAGPAKLVGVASDADHTILVVDDNHDAAVLLADGLRTLGYRVCTAHDGVEAIGLAEAVKPRAALLDLGLPVMDGYEIARRLRESEALAGIRLIAVTGYGQPADRERSAAAGFDAHLVKPVSLEQVQEALAPRPSPAPISNS